MMKNIALFCGSNVGNNPLFAAKAVELGKLIADNGYTLIYGGSSWGLMGVVAGEVLKHRGKVVGIIPEFFSEDVVEHSPDITLHRVRTMGERKEMMASMADAFVALPGGIGTMDEITEIMSLNQLGVISKPIGLLNCNGFYDSFLKQMEVMHSENLVHEVHKKMLLHSDEPKQLLDMLLG